MGNIETLRHFFTVLGTLSQCVQHAYILYMQTSDAHHHYRDLVNYKKKKKMKIFI